MAENSLFAILLRSRWWVSALVALGFVVVAFAMLPESLRVIGALGGAPFVVISVMAARRQWGLPGPAKVQALLTAAGTMGWNEFAEALATAWRREGYAVRRVDGPGADLALERQGRTTLVSAKRWKAARVGAEALRDLLQAIDKQEAHYGIAVALGEPTDAARAFARDNGLTLLGGEALARLLRDMPLPPKA
ncbi:restriction endonuclease [Aquincola sp. MAHUQ-54]|uniref:Restriction endonuclease n=1 Tax=Aquincola agrisoli TaxID=3119538 RepID=A0AAW9QBF5_9BURK